MTSQTNQKQDALASEIAQALGEADLQDKYLVCCHKYPRWIIEKAYKDAKSVPLERIKKSRAAVFFYLVKQYAHKTPYNSRR